MKITTNQFGELDFDENIVINFKEGLLGFEELKKFILISEENGIFYWLNSVEEPEIVFPLFPMRLLENGFSEEAGEPFGIVRLDKNPSDITINLKAPIYIDQDNKNGFQKIIDNDDYQIDYKLFVEN